MTKNWQRWASALTQQTCALYLASRHPQVPWLAKLLILLVVAYALSPIDLIPDFIPILGYLDDLLLLPLGIWLAVRLIPPPVWHSCQQSARQNPVKLPANRWVAAAIVLLWLLLTALLLNWLWLYLSQVSQPQD